MTRDKDDPASAESWTVVDGQAPLTSAASAPLFSPGDILLERYELRHILGRGGMGVVFETYDRVLDQTIALKIVRAEYAGERAWAERLAREVKLARQINHPNVCRVFDIGMAERHPFLTMEFASRGTLRDEIASGDFTARPLEERLSDVRAIASGLAAIHAAGIIHRDVTPQNVLRLADGSLVLSDFGLATDRFEGTSSLQGGTLSYMAPEVIRGARASMASDSWSLAVVVHEIIFGTRPRWSENGKDLLAPDLGRPRDPTEKLISDVCRACLVADPEKRPDGATDIAIWLREGIPVWRRRPPTWAVGVAGAVALAVGVTAFGRAGCGVLSPAMLGTAAIPMLVPSGTPEDWTQRSRLLADVGDGMECMVPLPDGESLRFVWGHPRKAEDVNVRTGTRHASDLVPVAFAEGCPDMTRDGRLVFTGHTADERPFAFLSAHPDGRDATAVVSIAEPSHLADPVWFPDGDRFQYQIDSTHAAIYSVSTKQLTVLSPRSEEFHTIFGDVVVGRSVLLPTSFDLTTEVEMFSSPFVGPDVRFRVPFFATHVASLDGRSFFMAVSNQVVDAPVVMVDATALQARVVGMIPGQALRRPVLVAGGLAFLSLRMSAILAAKGRDDVAAPPDVVLASRCGQELVGMRLAGQRRLLVRLDQNGRKIGDLSVDAAPNIPQCSPDGRTLYYLGNENEIRRCEAGRCSAVAKDVFDYSLSPDGSRIAMLTTNNPPLGLVMTDSSGAWRKEASITKANPCRPSWQTNDLVWVSLRRGRSLVWEQVAVPSGVPTGQTRIGQSDCTNGNEDPATPFPPDVRIIRRTQFQVRVVDSVPGVRRDAR